MDILKVLSIIDKMNDDTSVSELHKQIEDISLSCAIYTAYHHGHLNGRKELFNQLSQIKP